MTLIRKLWSTRDLPPLLSGEWCKAWTKRTLQVPQLLKQVWFHWILKFRGAILGDSTFFSSLTLIQGNFHLLNVGQENFIGRVQMALHAGISIGNKVCINDGVRLLTASHDICDSQWRTVSAPIVIEDYVWIATGATILPGVKVGRGAVIGAGAVVSKDVAPGAVMVGNPARSCKRERVTILDYSPVTTLALSTAWKRVISAKPTCSS